MRRDRGSLPTLGPIALTMLARTDRRGKRGPVLMLAHGGGLACRVCSWRGPATGQFLAANPMAASAISRAISAIPTVARNPRDNPVARACAVSWAGDAVG